MGSYTIKCCRLRSTVILINTYIMKISFKMIEVCFDMKYATVLTFTEKFVHILYFVVKLKIFKIKRRDMQYETFKIYNI